MRRAQALMAIAAALAVVLWLLWLLEQPLRLRSIELGSVDATADVGPIDSPPVTRLTTRPPERVHPRRPVPTPLKETPPEETPLEVTPFEDDAYLQPPSAFEVGMWHVTLPDAPRLPAPTSPPARVYDPDAATRVLQDGVRQRDKELGLELPGARRIANAIASYARTHAPAVSLGSFMVHVGADGRVRSVRLLWFRDGRRSAWERIATESARHLAGERFELRSHLARGALVEVQVVSNVEFPSGSARNRELERPRSLEGPRWPWAPAPGPRLSRREEGTWTPLPPDMERLSAPPEATLPPCDPGEPLCPGFRFDIANLVTRKTHVVHTRVDVAPVRGGDSSMERIVR